MPRPTMTAVSPRASAASWTPPGEDEGHGLLRVGARKAAVRIMMPHLTLMPGRPGRDREGTPVQERITPLPPR